MRSFRYFVVNYCYLRTTTGRKLKWDKPFAYQEKFFKAMQALEDIFVLKSRRIGASWCACAYALWLCMYRPDIVILLLSRKEFYAKRLLTRIKFIYKHLPSWMRPKMGTSSKTEISFVYKSGDELSESFVFSLTTTDESGRGEDAMLIIMDEAAFILAAEDTWSAVGPSGAWGGQRIVISTPNGTGGFFHRNIMLLQAGLSKAFTYIEAHWKRNCGLSDKWYEKATAGLSMQRRLQEFELQFLSTGRPFFDPIKLRQCYKPPTESPEIVDLMRRTKYHFSGVDTAEGHSTVEGEPDYHSVTVLNEFGVQVDQYTRNDVSQNEFTGHIAQVGDERVKIEGIPAKFHREYPGGMAIEQFGPGDVTVAMHDVPDDHGFSWMTAHRQTNSFKMRILNSLRLAVNELQVVITDPFTYACFQTFEDQTRGVIEKAGAADGTFDDPVISFALAWMLLKKHGGQHYDFSKMTMHTGQRMVGLRRGQDLTPAQLADVLPVGRPARGPMVNNPLVRQGARDGFGRMTDDFDSVWRGNTRLRPPGV